MKFFKKLTAVLLALALSLSLIAPNSVAAATEKDYFPEVSPDDIKYGDMSRDLIDFEEVNAICAEIEALAAEEGNEAEIADKLEELFGKLKEGIYLVYVLRNDMYLDATDADAAAKYMQSEQDYYSLLNIFYAYGKPLLAADEDGTLAAELPEDIVLVLDEGEPPTEEQQALSNEVTALETEYQMLPSIVQIPISFMDGEYSYYDIYSMYLSGMISAEDYDAAITEIYRAYNESLEDVYLRMVAKRTEYAQSYGYDNFYDFAAENSFYRGTNIEQIAEFGDAVKEYISPIYYELGGLVNYLSNDINSLPKVNSLDYDPEAPFDYLSNFLEDISPEMLEAYDYMMEHDLCDMYNDGNRVASAYTAVVGDHKPYIQNGYGNEYYNIITTLTHEFGHYNVMYYFSDWLNTVGDYDLMEVHSTALEFLAMPYLTAEFEEIAEQIELYYVYSSAIYSIVYGCIIDELERFVYLEDVESIKEINEKYMELLRAYGMVDETDTRTEAYGWAEISHIFLSPCYYISYAMSAAAAFQLYIESLEDYDAAIDHYLSICGHGINDYFVDTMTIDGGADVTKKETVESLAKAFRERFDVAAMIEEYETYYNFKYYKVQSGDTLFKIAVKHEISMDDILALNAIEDPTKIYAGDVLVLPGTAKMRTAEYTIQPGDTLYEIAKAFGADMYSIAQQNGIEDITKIYAGDVLEFEY